MSVHLWHTGAFFVVLWTGSLHVGPDADDSTKKLSPNALVLVSESTEEKSVVASTLVMEKHPLHPCEIPAVLDFIRQHRDYTSYHLLIAVRRGFPASYKDIPDDTKAAILCSSLKNCQILDDWGSVSTESSFDRESAKALLGTRTSALKYLAPLLDDDKLAPVTGSSEATDNKINKVRRKDLAYRYASLILGASPAFHRDPSLRDRDIEELRTRLKKRKPEDD
jgi:hypothetical protein